MGERRTLIVALLVLALTPGLAGNLPLVGGEAGTGPVPEPAAASIGSAGAGAAGCQTRERAQAWARCLLERVLARSSQPESAPVDPGGVVQLALALFLVIELLPRAQRAPGGEGPTAPSSCR